MKVIVFGATGAIGTALIEILSTEHGDWEIVAITSQANSKSRLAAAQLPNVRLQQGDVMDKDAVLKLCEPCDLIFCTVGFSRYEAKYWAANWPKVTENLLEAARTKKLVFCDNLYAYGNPEGKISPSSPTVPPSLKTKPGIRSWMRERFVQHMKDYPKTLTVVGASDFFGPQLTDKTFLGDPVTGKIVQGQSPMAFGKHIHDFAYAPDFSKALAKVAVEDKAYDHFWIAPHSIHDKTIPEIARDMAELAGEKNRSVTIFRPWMVYAMSPFMGFMRELIEMLPFWTKDYRVDDSDFIREFDMPATPYEQALKEYVQFYQSLKDK